MVILLTKNDMNFDDVTINSIKDVKTKHAIQFDFICVIDNIFYVDGGKFKILKSDIWELQDLILDVEYLKNYL